jgi:hypothetical protein
VDDPYKASECKDKVLEELRFRLNNYSAVLATFAIEVEVQRDKKVEPKPPPYVFRGSGFLVNRDFGFFITSKHVMLGDIVWDMAELGRSDFADFESAMEDLLSSPAASITARPYFFDKGIRVRLVAFDRANDLVLLQATNISQLAFYNQSAFQAIRLGRQRDCVPNMQVIAMGFPSSNPLGRVAITEWTPVTDCTLVPQTALIGGRRFRFPLLTTQPVFEAGMSGGPVFDKNIELVGVVAGGLAGGKASFFVPVSAVRSFLERYGALPNP